MLFPAGEHSLAGELHHRTGSPVYHQTQNVGARVVSRHIEIIFALDDASQVEVGCENPFTPE